MRTCLYCSGRSSVRCKAGEQQPSGDLLLRRGSCQWRRCSRRLQFLRHVGMPDYFLLPQQRLRHLHPHPWAVPWRRHRWASLTPSNTSLTVSCCWVEWIKKKNYVSFLFFFSLYLLYISSFSSYLHPFFPFILFFPLFLLSEIFLSFLPSFFLCLSFFPSLCTSFLCSFVLSLLLSHLFSIFLILISPPPPHLLYVSCTRPRLRHVVYPCGR